MVFTFHRGDLLHWKRFYEHGLKALAMLGGFCDPTLGTAAPIEVAARTSFGTDAIGSHLFLINPAAYRPHGMEAALLSLRTLAKNEYKDVNQGGGGIEQETLTSDSYFAVAVLADLGAGLAIALHHEQLKNEDKSRSLTRSDNELLESLGTRYTQAKAMVELSKQVSAGFAMRFLEEQVDVIGNFSLNNRRRTAFKPSLFGAGGGLHLHMDRFQAGATYFPALKGKAEVYSEEKIITEPGTVELAAAVGDKPYALGIAMRRPLYKRDDRATGTTLNDANATRINLLGLNVERNQVFLLDQKEIAVDYELARASVLTLGYAINTCEFNTALTSTLPGENSRFQSYTYHEAKLRLAVNHKNLQFSALLVKALKKKASFARNNNSVTFVADSQTIALSVGARL